MRPVTLGTLLKGVAETFYPDTMIYDVVTDSRAVSEGKLYVAIVGERYDGNDFTREAFERGAQAAVVSTLAPKCDGEQLLVNDTRDALVAMAGNYRDLYDFRSIAVTGSVGKTTVKEMTGAILETFGKTLKTYGNRNNAIGLPETLFRLTDDIEYAVLEMGMSNRGEIDILSRAVKPNVAIITCIGVSHMEYLGSKENILKAKLEITEGMGEDGIVVYNGDDELLEKNLHGLRFKTVSFGIDNREAMVRAANISGMGAKTLFTILDAELGSFSAELPAVGRHSILNALAAYCAVTRLGLPPQKACEGLKNYVPFGMRQNIVEHNGAIIIEDCYNASPESMKASLRILSDIVQSGLKIAVLGDMRELGELSDSAHKEIGREAAKLGIDMVLCYGKQARLIAESAAAAGVTFTKHFEDRLEIADHLKKSVREGDGVLFKASRAMEFEKIIENFYN